MLSSGECVGSVVGISRAKPAVLTSGDPAPPNGKPTRARYFSFVSEIHGEPRASGNRSLSETVMMGWQ